MLRKFFDFNKTIKHVPYKVLKAQHQRAMRRSELLFKALLWLSIVGMAIVAYWSLIR